MNFNITEQSFDVYSCITLQILHSFFTPKDSTMKGNTESGIIKTSIELRTKIYN